MLLGILAAFALPKYANLTTAANISVLESIGGAVLSAANIVHTKALVLGVQGEPNATIDLDRDGVADKEVRYGYPTASRAPSSFRDLNNVFKAMDSNSTTDLAWGRTRFALPS